MNFLLAELLPQEAAEALLEESRDLKAEIGIFVRGEAQLPRAPARECLTMTAVDPASEFLADFSE